MLLGASRRRLPFRALAAVLAAVMLVGSLVYFVGTGTSPGTLIDAIRGGGGPVTLEEEIERRREAVERDASDEDAWIDLLNAQFRAAAVSENLDRRTGEATPAGRRAFEQVARTWDRYLQLVPQRIPTSAAGGAAAALGLVGRYADALDAQRIVVERRPSSAGWAMLARLAYLAGREKVGDRAAARAIRLAPSGKRREVEQQVAILKLLGQSGGATGAGGQPQIPLDALAQAGRRGDR